jgi:hypothetical protein
MSRVTRDQMIWHLVGQVKMCHVSYWRQHPDTTSSMEGDMEYSIYQSKCDVAYHMAQSTWSYRQRCTQSAVASTIQSMMMSIDVLAAKWAWCGQGSEWVVSMWPGHGMLRGSAPKAQVGPGVDAQKRNIGTCMKSGCNSLLFIYN